MGDILNLIGSGLGASKEWMEATANNIANINTTRTAEGGPYRRQSVVFQAQNGFDQTFDKTVGDGVRATKIVEDNSQNIVYDPSHPDADAQGYVRYPAINVAAEMTNMISAQRGYGADVTTLNAAKKMIEKTLEIGK